MLNDNSFKITAAGLVIVLSSTLQSAFSALKYLVWIYVRVVVPKVFLNTLIPSVLTGWRWCERWPFDSSCISLLETRKQPLSNCSMNSSRYVGKSSSSFTHLVRLRTRYTERFLNLWSRSRDVKWSKPVTCSFFIETITKIFWGISIPMFYVTAAANGPSWQDAIILKLQTVEDLNDLVSFLFHTLVCCGKHTLSLPFSMYKQRTGSFNMWFWKSL